VAFFSSALQYLKECKIALAERFAPFLIASTGCHILNLENQKREFYFERGRVANLRLHVFFCAPPGWTKTTMLQSFLDGPYSILGGCPQIETGLEGSMTEAGFVGTIKVVNGEPVEQYGAAYEHRDAIVGIDEFAALTNAMKMEHSVNLDNAMCTGLDSGFMIKRLALGKLQYLTNLTLWTGSQPARFDLTSGLGRRFIFIWFIPTPEEAKMVKETRRKGRNVLPLVTTVHKIRNDVIRMTEDAKMVKRIEFDSSIYRTLDRLNVPHFEEQLYERLALGYTLASGISDKTLTVQMDTKLEKLFKLSSQWRLEIKKGAEVSQVFEIVKQMDMCSLTDVKNRLTDFGLTYSKSSTLLDVLRRQGRIEFVQETKKRGKGRPTTVVMVLGD